MPSVCVRDLRSRFKVIRIFLLVLFLPICLLMLFCAMYSTYLSINTWNCRQTDVQINSHKNKSDLTNGPHSVKCYTILDSISGQISKYIPERKVLLIIRTGSLINTLGTYISAWIAIYKMSLLPMVWLTIVSLASFFITLNFTILYGPMTGINNFELVPIFIGLDLSPVFVTTIVLILDLLISIISISLVISGYKKKKNRQ